MNRPNVVNIHATCVVLARAAPTFGARHDAGVLIMGKSGAGKSDLALRLIERGAILVADDRTDLLLTGGSLIARAPANLRGLMEVRGVGIVAVPCAPKTRVSLAVTLDGTRASRLPEPDVITNRRSAPLGRSLIAAAAFELRPRRLRRRCGARQTRPPSASGRGLSRPA